MQTANLKSYVRHQINNAKGRFFGTHYTVGDALRFKRFRDEHPKSELLRTGFQALGNAPAEIVAEMETCAQTAVEKPNKTMKDVDGNIVNRTLDNITLSPALDQLIRDWVSAAAGFPEFATLYAIKRVTAWRNFGFDEKRNAEIFSNRYHLDADPQTMVKLFIHMSDVDADCGPFRYLAMEDTRQVLKSGFRYRAQQTEKDTENLDRRCVVATGSKGTSFLVMTSRLVHRASVPVSGRVRDMLQIEFHRK